MEGQCSRARVKIRWQGERRGSRNVSCPPKFAHARFFFNNFFDNIIYLRLRALLSAFCSVVKITCRSLQVSHLSFIFLRFAGKYKATHFICRFIPKKPLYFLPHFSVLQPPA